MRIKLELVLQAYLDRGMNRRYPHHAVAFDHLWNDIARRYAEGKLSDTEYDSLLSKMP